MLTQKELKKIISYDPKTGIFIWKIKPAPKSKANAGDIAGHVSFDKKQNYKRMYLGYKNKTYPLSRLAFLYMVGSIPPIVDHINRDGCDNRWDNLRAANKSGNAANSRIHSTNTSGFRGVNRRTDGLNRKRIWRAFIKIGDKQKSLGSYHTKKEAAIAYNKAALEFFGEFANLNKVDL